MKKRKLKKSIKIFIIIFMIFIGVLCIYILNYKKEVIEKKETSDIIEKEEERLPEKKLQVLDLNSNSRPYAVMINNISTVWGYQCGLSDAYLIYEIIVEGGYTRLMALFKDKNLDRIGSVRSSRHYFLDYALENDAIYVHFGWSPQAQNDMASLGVNNINFISFDGYERDYSLGLATEHTAFTSTEKINSGIDYYGYRNTSDNYKLLNYSVDELDLSTYDGNITANTVKIDYSPSRTTSFIYDSENKIYKRYQNDKEHIDYVTKEQYTAQNIITYQVSNYTISGDDKGRQTLDNIGSGDGYYITRGYAIPITWEKTSRSSKTLYKYLDGTEISVNDGNTYIEIQPKNRELIIE